MEHRTLAQHLLDALAEEHLLTVTSRRSLENILRVPSRDPQTKAEREFDDKMFAKNTRTLHEYATAVMKVRQRQLHEFARRFRL